MKAPSGPGLPLLLAAALLLPAPLGAQESTIYLAVVATRLFVVGAANPQTGIHFQHPSADTSWDHTGPNNTRAFGVAVHPGSDQKVVYIASGNGLQRSGDGGRTWKITTGWNITEVLGVTPDPHSAGTVYIATAYGVYRTTDGCATWKECNAGLGSTFVPSVIADHQKPGVLYCATEGGAYKSTDRGDSWQRMGLSVGGVRVIVQHPTNPDVLAVGTEEFGIYMSANGGKWWTRCEAGIDHKTFYTIAFDPTGPDTMYAGGYVTGVYKSIDGGKRWRRVNSGLGVLTFHALAVDPRDSRRVYAGAYWGGVYRSDDAGDSWRQVGLSDSQVWTIFIHP